MRGLFNNNLSLPEEAIGVDIFSGAGGLSLGARESGINVKYAVEIWHPAAETYRHNHPDAIVIEDDITKVNPKERLGTDSDNIFIIMGGPPCQGFSTSNMRHRSEALKNPKNRLFCEFVRFVRELQPDWFVFENVSGIINIEKGEVINIIRQSFANLGYDVSLPKILWANNYGVPQKRNRCFIVGNRVGVSFEFPTSMGTNISVWDAIGDLPSLKPRDNIEEVEYAKTISEASYYARSMRENSSNATQNWVSQSREYVIRRYEKIPQGGNWRNIPDNMMTNYTDKTRCHSGIYKRLRPDEPSVVISNYRKSMLIHPYEHRGLSVREAARLQSFPDDFVFKGPLTHVQQQIGNAVPPLLAKAVFDQVLSYYKANE